MSKIVNKTVSKKPETKLAKSVKAPKAATPKLKEDKACPVEDTVGNTESAFNRKTWFEFRNTGLLLFVNMFLHMFGWSIVVVVGDDDIVQAVYPARTTYRGFGEESIAKAYRNLAAYVAKTASALKKEAES